jgi:hypothetical protein
MRNEDYIKLKERKSEIMYAHCRNCLEDMSGDHNPATWSNLEAIIDLKTGVLTLGCKRCNLPIVCAMMPNDIIKHMGNCGCELCRKEG